MQPFNYQLQIRDPFESALSGLRLGVAERGVEEQRQQAALEQQAMQQNMERQRQLNSRIDTMLQGGLDNATAQDFAEIGLLSKPEAAKQALESFRVLDEVKQRDTLQRGGALLSAVKNKQFGFAKQLLTDRSDALTNANRPQDQAEIANIARHIGLLDTNPEAVQLEFSIGLASLGKEGQEVLARILPTAKEDSVQSGKILDDGTTVVITKSGLSKVRGPDGQELEGQARVDAIITAEKVGVAIQERRAGAQARGRLQEAISLGGTAESVKKSGAIAQDQGTKAFETLNKIKTNIGNLDAAIKAIDKGAKTGVIESQFPNWRASTIELQNIQSQLGLDIVGAVTFGALSKGELDLALNTALPTTMDEKQLRNWLISKKESQIKLSKYLDNQVTHLLTPGNTLGTWLKSQRPSSTAPAAAPPSEVRSRADAILRGQ